MKRRFKKEKGIGYFMRWIILIILLLSCVAAIEPTNLQMDTIQGYVLGQSIYGINNAALVIYSEARGEACGIDNDCCAVCKGTMTYYTGSDGSYAISTADLVYTEEVNNCILGDRLKGASCERDIDPSVDKLWLEVDGENAVPDPYGTFTSGKSLWVNHWDESKHGFVFNFIIDALPISSNLELNIGIPSGGGGFIDYSIVNDSDTIFEEEEEFVDFVFYREVGTADDKFLSFEIEIPSTTGRMFMWIIKLLIGLTKFVNPILYYILMGIV